MKKILLLSFLLLAIIGCSNDKEDDNVDILSEIVGTWAVGTTTNSIDYTIWINFKVDQTYTIYDLTDESNKQEGTFTYDGYRMAMSNKDGTYYDVYINKIDNLNAELTVTSGYQSITLYGKKRIIE